MALIMENIAKQKAEFWMRAAASGAHPALLLMEVAARIDDQSEQSANDTEPVTIDLVYERFLEDMKIEIGRAVDGVYVQAATTPKNEDFVDSSAVLVGRGIYQSCRYRRVPVQSDHSHCWFRRAAQVALRNIPSNGCDRSGTEPYGLSVQTISDDGCQSVQLSI
jgi:hypothetical protein